MNNRIIIFLFSIIIPNYIVSQVANVYSLPSCQNEEDGTINVEVKYQIKTT